MRNIILLSAIILLFSSCSENATQAQSISEKYDLQPYLLKLDSLGNDVGNDTLLLQIGRYNNYYGKNKRGNALIEFALSKRDTITDEDYHDWSVQNTKNGNYAIAIDKLEKAMEINPRECSAYYGWLLLYYYRDYEKALMVIEQCDAYTPNFSDAPMGEDVHYLKGLCHMQLNRYQKAIDEFDIYINNLATTHGEDFVDVYTFVQRGRCLSELGRFEEAVLSFKKAIKYFEKCSEAYYYMGLTQLKLNKKDNACSSFHLALDLINKGNKSSDNYVEYFHEIYPLQIEAVIEKTCSE